MTERQEWLCDQFPSDQPEYLFPAWCSCLQWAIGFDPIRKQFADDTGLSYSAPRSPMESMIDDACGVGDAYIRAFVPWFNENVWGHLEGPVTGRENRS